MPTLLYYLIIHINIHEPTSALSLNMHIEELDYGKF